MPNESRRPPLPAVLVLAGVLFFATLLWCFFPTLLGLEAPPADDPARLAIPFVVALALGAAIGSLASPNAVRLTQWSIGPALVLGGLLGLFAALRPHHLLIVVALVVLYDAAAVAGAVLGRRIGGRRVGAARQPG